MEKEYIDIDFGIDQQFIFKMDFCVGRDVPTAYLQTEYVIFVE